MVSISKIKIFIEELLILNIALFWKYKSRMQYILTIMKIYTKAYRKGILDEALPSFGCIN